MRKLVSALCTSCGGRRDPEALHQGALTFPPQSAADGLFGEPA